MSKATQLGLKALYTLFLVATILNPSIGAVYPKNLQQSETFDQHLAKGKEALDKDDRATAYWELENARIKEPDRAEPYALFARLRIRENRLDQAMEKIETGLKYRPDNAALHYVLAEVMWRTRNTENAAVEIDKAYKLGERSSTFYLLMSEVMLSPAGRSLISSTGHTPSELLETAYSEALGRYQEALRLLPANDPNKTELEKRIKAITGLREFRSRQNDKTFTPPKATTYPKPDYTEEARKHNVSGFVTVAVFVNESGQTEEAVVTIGLGFGLDDQAVTTAKKIKWSPAMKDGKPVSSCVAVHVGFSTS